MYYDVSMVSAERDSVAISSDLRDDVTLAVREE